MTKSTRAAAAAGFALTLMLCFNSEQAFAQQANASSSGYRTPSTTAASMVETPAAPSLRGALCGTIGPETSEPIVMAQSTSEPVREVSAVLSADDLIAGKFDGGMLLRNFSSDLEQFKGKLAEKAFSFIESLQTVGHKDQPIVAPSGYAVRQQPVSAAPAIF